MVIFSFPFTRSHLLLETFNAFKKGKFCSSKAGVGARSGGVDKPVEHKTDAQYHFDIKEVRHHEAMAKDWWDPNGPLKALYAMNDIRIPFIKNGLVNSHRLKALEVKDKVKFLEGVNILDVGCGGGILSEALARLGGSVTGIDPSEQLISVARSHSRNLQHGTPPTYAVSTVEQHATNAMRTYDVVIASEVIEHVQDKESFLAASIAALKLGGSLFITTPNRTLVAWLSVIMMAERLLHIVPQGTHSYSKFIKPNELSVLLEKYGCSIQLINGMFYDPVRNQWLWFPTKAFTYAVHAIKIKDLFR